MTEIDDLFQKKTAPRGQAALGTGAKWLLHLLKILFVVYSFTHMSHLSLTYAAETQMGVASQFAGIFIVDLVMIGLFVALHNLGITGTVQVYVAYCLWGVAFIISTLGIVADSQINAGLALAPWMVNYVRWVLPAAPAIVSLGLFIIARMDPHNKLQRELALSQHDSDEADTKLAVAIAGARRKTRETTAAIGILTERHTAENLYGYLMSDDVQRRIRDQAQHNLGNILNQHGVSVPGMLTADNPVFPTTPLPADNRVFSTTPLPTEVEIVPLTANPTSPHLGA